MSKEKEITCEIITKMTKNIRARKLRFFAKVTEEISIEILKVKKIHFYKLRNMNIYKDASNGVIELSSLILAIDEYYKTISEVSQQSINLKDKMNRAKKKTKTDFLAENWSKIKELRKEGHSLRDLREYFIKYHKFSISVTTIHNKWKEWEN